MLIVSIDGNTSARDEDAFLKTPASPSSPA
jgi:hypothetical protein